MKRLILGISLGLATTALAATNLTLSLPDDANAVARWGCEHESGAPCNAAASKAWLEARIEARLLEEIRQQKRALATSKVPAFCALFTAATAANRDAYCTAIGDAAGCTPPQCQ
jgi:hypothetical protein